MRNSNRAGPRRTCRRHKRRPPEIVSYNMSRIRSSGSAIERKLGSAMYSLGLRYRKQYRIEGRPDFAYPSDKVAVFCDSSFWHGRHWEEVTKKQIRHNRDFWKRKIERNIQRDKEVNDVLVKRGWVVLRFWDNEISEDSLGCAEVVKRAIARRRNRRS